MKLTEHFTLDELIITDVRGMDNTPSAEVLSNLYLTAVDMEEVRRILGNPITIRSGYRSKAVNTAVGGSQTSAHCDGWAVDFICPHFGSPLDVAKKLETVILYDQLIYEGTWVHISFDPRMRKQVLTAHFDKGKPTRYTNGLN